MKNVIQVILALTFTLGSTSCHRTFLVRFNPEYKDFSHVFEGKILEVNLFPCDENGNKIPLNKAISTKYGILFRLDSITRSFGLSEATIQVQKKYKGRLKTDTVIIESFTSQLSIYLNIIDSDTTIRYDYVPRSHGALPLILPYASIGKNRVFHCKESYSGLENRVSLANRRSTKRRDFIYPRGK